MHVLPAKYSDVQLPRKCDNRTLDRSDPYVSLRYIITKNIQQELSEDNDARRVATITK